MRRRTWLHKICLVASVLASPPMGLAAAPHLAVSAAPKPNILVILVDDMGFSDLGCYGSEISTPNLDALAASGLRFTQFYNGARCCPTRASLLTGLYAHQTGLGNTVSSDKQAPGYRGRLSDECVTIADVLRGAGYFTAMSGKWHVGDHFGVVPWNRGFDRSLNVSAATGFYHLDGPKSRLFLNGKALANDDPLLPKDWYTTDVFTDFGLTFIDEALAAQKPFFLYLAYNAPHTPVQAPAADIARYRGTYKAGWDKLREQRYTKQVGLGIVDQAWPLAPRPDDVKAWDSLSPAEQDRFDHIMAIYAACVDHMDRAVGRLVAELRQRSVLDNTLILFLSDNGAEPASHSDKTRDANGSLEGDSPGDSKSVVYQGASWAMLSDTPFRLYKRFAHEGGIATPFIAHWPAGIAAKNELRDQPAHIVDLMATCVDVAGATYPAELNGKPIPPMEGKSLLPAFENRALAREALYWEHEGNAAVRVGDWKLARAGRDGAWELYDMKADRSELHDLAAKQPERAKNLAAKWEAWALRTHVKPYPGLQDTAPRKIRRKRAVGPGAE